MTKDQRDSRNASQKLSKNGFTPQDRLQLVRQARMLNEVHKGLRHIRENDQHTR